MSNKILFCLFLISQVISSQTIIRGIGVPNYGIEMFNLQTGEKHRFGEKYNILSFTLLGDTIVVIEREKFNSLDFSENSARIHLFNRTTLQELQEYPLDKNTSYSGKLYFTGTGGFFTEKTWLPNCKDSTEVRFYENFQDSGRVVEKLTNAYLLGCLNNGSILFESGGKYGIYSNQLDKLEYISQFPNNYYIVAHQPFGQAGFLAEVESKKTKEHKLLLFNKNKIKTIYNAKHNFRCITNGSVIAVLTEEGIPEPYRTKWYIKKLSRTGRIIEQVNILDMLQTRPFRASFEVTTAMQGSKIYLTYFETVLKGKNKSGIYSIDVNCMKKIKKLR